MTIYEKVPNAKEISRRMENCRREGGEILDLSSLYMTELPAEIESLENLGELNLSDNQLQSLPDWVGNMRSLKKLNLWGNNIDSLPGSFAGLKRLVFLDIGENLLKEMPACLKDFTSLKHLNLESMYTGAANMEDSNTTLPEWIGDLSALRFLNLRHCRLESLPGSMRDLSSLRVLYLGANWLATLPEWLGGFAQLEELDISKNWLHTIPEFIGNLKNLRSLDLGYSRQWAYEARGNISIRDGEVYKLKRLPDFLDTLPRLVHLDLGNTGLKSLPGPLRILRLESLKLHYNELTKIPEWIGSMTSLLELDLSMNEKLKSLPDSLNRLCNLEELNISRTPIGKIPKCIRELKKLKKLSLGSPDNWPRLYFFGLKIYYKSPVIPQWIEKLSNLEYLYLGYQATEIPESIGALLKLKRLDINYSKIKTLPESMSKLSALKEIFIEGCDCLEKLPESFTSLSSLRELSITYSGIRSLPGSFGNLSALEKIDLSFTDIETLPESFGNLRNLKWFKTSFRNYACLPVSFGNLASLEELYLTGDKITFPKSFGGLQSLRVFHLERYPKPVNVIQKDALFSSLNLLGVCHPLKS